MTDEKALGQDIRAFVYGRPLPYARQEKYGHVLANKVLRGGGSGNIPLMGAALLCATRHQGILEFWRDYFRLSRETFMGRELMSRIYGVWHFISVLVVYTYGPQELKAEARAWIECFVTLLWLTSDSTGRTCFGGMRSAGHEIAYGGYCWILAAAEGRSVAKWSKGWRGRWEYAVLAKLKGKIAEACSDWRRHGNRVLFLAGFEPIVPVYLEKSAVGGSYWMPRNVNGNTPPWLGARISKGEPARVLPENGGIRIRQKFDHATCERQGMFVEYDGDLYPDARMALLPSTPDFSIAWGAEVVAPPPPEDPPPDDPVNQGGDDPPEERPPSQSWIDRLKDWWGRIFG